MTRHLLIGAGAVGLPYGRHLALGGAEVAFFVRPTHLERLGQPTTFYRLRSRDRRVARSWTGYGLTSTAEEAAAFAPDVVWICVSATALRSPSIEAVLARVGPAIVVSLTPGMTDREYLLERVDAGRLVLSTIPIVSYQAPLPGERVPRPGIAYWLPPLARFPISGPAPALREVGRALAAGGWKAQPVPDAARWAAAPSAILTAFVDRLEAAGWSLDRFRRGRFLDETVTAARQAIRIACAYHAMSPPRLAALLRPALLTPLLASIDRLVPWDFETYFDVHFTKVGDQTTAAIDGYIDEGRRRGLPVDALERLRTDRRNVTSM